MRFLFVDRILELSPHVVRGLKHVSSDDFFLTLDDEGKPCFTPSLIGESIGQLAAWSIMAHNNFSARPVAGVVARACMHRPVHLGETLWLEAVIESVDEVAISYRGNAWVGEQLVFAIDGALGPLLPMIDFIQVDEVQRQFNEIYRPGLWPALRTVVKSSISIEHNSHNSYSMVYDKIINSMPGVSLVAEKYISRSAPYFPDHFPHKPVLPMTVLLECNLNLAREFIRQAGYSQAYQICELRRIKMSEFVRPGDIVVTVVGLKSYQDDQLILSFRSEVDGKRVCVVDVVMVVKGSD
ncbi:MAG: hydroxymyristoyl-ACP dehydratase [Legionella sp.]